MLSIVRILFFILIVSQAQAIGLYNVGRPTWSLGMGGVYTAFPNEFDMPTANAAYLSRLKSTGIELFNLGIGGPGVAKATEFQELPPADSIADLNDYYGKPIWTGFDGRASFVMPNFGISFYNNFSLYSYLNNPLMPEWYIEFLNDYGATLAFAIPMGNDQSFGLAFKRISRWGGENTIGFGLIDQYLATQDSNVILDEFQDKGIGYGLDVSYLYRSESSAGPIFTLVWKDVGYTSFHKTSGTTAPPSLHENLTMGLGYELDGPGVDVKAGFEYTHITTKNVQLGKKLHLGTELSLPLVDLRFGLNQGYSTFGLGFDFWVMRFELASYTEELGVYPGQTPDSRVILGITMDLSVDADFGISTRDGKKRNLKQRR